MSGPRPDGGAGAAAGGEGGDATPAGGPAPSGPAAFGPAPTTVAVPGGGGSGARGGVTGGAGTRRGVGRGADSRERAIGSGVAQPTRNEKRATRATPTIPRAPWPRGDPYRASGFRGNFRNGSRASRMMIWSARMSSGGAKPVAPAAVTRSSCSTPSPLTPSPPTSCPFL